MPRYLSSFDDGSMNHIPEADLPGGGRIGHRFSSKKPSPDKIAAKYQR